MARSQTEGVLRHLHQLLGSGTVAPDDGRLLQRFVANHDEDAFAELVARHGPLVFGLCRRVLRDAHDAEDVFQATFLVLARKAASIRKPASLSCFLHGVAYRLAVRAKTEADRRRAHERRATPVRDSEDSDLSWRDMRTLIDEELQRLPETMRLPLVLCYLEENTQDEAARRLGWPRGTLKRRLERGRERLRIRLTHRGVTLGASLFAVALTEGGARGVPPTALRKATVQAGMLFTTSEPGALAATRAAMLAKEAMQTMLTTKLKLGAMRVLLLGSATAAGLASQQTPSVKQPAIEADAPAQARSKASDRPQARDKQTRTDRQGDALPEGAIARLGTLRLRHKTMTSSAVFTRDGKTVIVGDGDGGIVFWDVVAGKEVRRLNRLEEDPGALAITTDGKTLAVGKWGRVTLWEVATGKFLCQGTVKNDAVRQLLFTPDGKTLAVRNQGDTIQLWNCDQKKVTHELKGHTGKIACMTLHPDGKTLASGSWGDPQIRLWDLNRGRERLHFAAHERDVLSVNYSPDGKTLASIGNLASFAFFDAATGKKLRTAPNYYGGAQEIIYSPDGKVLAGIENDRVVLFDAATGKRLRPFVGSRRSMAGLTFSPDGKTLATFWGGAHTFDLWDVASGKLLHPAPGHRHYITSLAFSADGQTVFSAAGISEHALSVWNAQTGEQRIQIGDNPNGVQALALSPDGKLLAACGYNDNTIRLWDADHKVMRVFKGHTSPIDSVVWSADGKTLASGSFQDKSLRIWDAVTGRQRLKIETNLVWPADVTLSPDGKLLASGGYPNGTIRLWSVETGKELRSITTPQQFVYTLAFSPGGTILVSGGMSGAIHLCDPTTGRILRHWDTKAGWIGKVAFVRDGRSVVCGYSDGSVRLWEVATGKERACFAGHRGAIRAVAISRDSRRIASGSEDTTILVWDATVGARPAATLSPKQLNTLWSDLLGSDAGRAYRAIWQMALVPCQALPFLAERLHPIAPLDAEEQKQIERLLADLDNERFSIREQAEAALEKKGASVEPALRNALENKPALEVRRRIEKVLEKVAGWSPERLRSLRALEAIERMDTPEARQTLQALANGTPRAWLTEEAQAIRLRPGAGER